MEKCLILLAASSGGCWDQSLLRHTCSQDRQHPQQLAAPPEPVLIAAISVRRRRRSCKEGGDEEGEIE